MDRRDFIQNTGLAVGAGLVATSATQAEKMVPAGSTPLTFPDLPYEYNALEPYIDAKTMELHHDKHHRGYFDGMLKAETELQKCRETATYGLIEYWSKKAAFNAGGFYLHALFWTIMAPAGKGGGGPVPAMLSAALTENFGSVEKFKEHFSAAATAVEGSGWAILHFRLADKKLLILQAENQHKLSEWGTVPLLALDVWEHAYYLSYQNKRAEYVKAWWNVVNWNQVEQNFLKAASR